MKNIHVVDANVILRYLLADHPDHHQRARVFFEGVIRGDTRAFIPEGVLVECVYVLLKVYGVPRAEVADRLLGVLGYRGVANEDRAVLLAALRLFAKKPVDIVDALVVATAEARGWQTFSFDRDISKLVR
ncbi:MAG: PIN domain-containing protein [Thermodesulfobacteriota bacterium]